jgi:LPS-assembly lipoprotein
MWWSEARLRPPSPRAPAPAALRRAATAVLLALALAGCGFQLRGTQKLPFETIYVNTGLNSPLGATLNRQIRSGTETRTVPLATEANAVLDILAESRDKEILTLDAQGRAVEYKLIYRLRFRLHDGKGREYIAPTELRAQRDISINDAQVLAKESEEALLYRDMQTDLVQQLLRRIAAVKPHADQS